MILGAMGADFYPRLTAAARDNTTCNRLINEQSQVALLLVGPGIVATLALAPLVIRLFYSEAFLPAVDVLRWQILGLLGRIVSWPMAFVILAKGRGRVYVATELAAHSIHVLLVVYATRTWGLVGTGMAFFGLYLYYCVATRFVVGWISGFRWTPAYLRLLILYLAAILAAFAAPLVYGPLPTMVIGCAITTVVTAYSCRTLYRLLGPESLRRALDKLRSLPGFPPRK
jgi:PST family polysaccharide transporter